MSDRKLFSYDNLVHAVAGASGSVVGMSTFYPLDTVRCRLQLESRSEPGPKKTETNGNGHNISDAATNDGSSGTANHVNGDTTSYIGSVNPKNKVSQEQTHSTVIGAGTWREMQKIVKTEGVGGLYKGIIPVLQSLCASNFVYFYTFHGLRSVWGSRAVNGVKTQSATRDLLLGAVAGAVNVMVTTPLWVVNTRLKMSGTPYDNLYDGLIHIAQKEGIKELWAGAAPSLLLVANPALQFMMYESFKRRIGTPMSAFTSLIIGAVAKAIATVLTYPLQVAQAHLRHRGSKAPGKGAATPLLKKLIKDHGVRGLFKGLEAKLLQTVLTAALMFATYEKIVKFVFSLLHRNRRIIKH